MKIHSKDFRVREGDEVGLKKTSVDPVYKSKDQYKKILEQHVAPPDGYVSTRPIVFHQRRMELTAKLAVSLSMPTLAHPASP